MRKGAEQIINCGEYITHNIISLTIFEQMICSAEKVNCGGLVIESGRIFDLSFQIIDREKISSIVVNLFLTTSELYSECAG